MNDAFIHFDTREEQKKLTTIYKENGRFEELKKLYETPAGANIDKRWLVSNKEFKPLRDLLKQSKDPVTVEFYDSTFANKSDIQQFVMSPEIAFEVQKLSKAMFADRTQNISKLIPKVMTPYPKVCVEMPLTEEVKNMRYPITNEGVGPVRRIGAYIKTIKDDATEDLIFTFTPYHEFETGFVCSSYVLLVHHNNEILPGFLPFKFYECEELVWNATIEPSLLVFGERNNRSVESIYNELCKKTNAFQLMVSEAAEDIATLFIAWLVILNSKSGITKTDVKARVPNAKLGKRERTRRGRSAYTVLSLNDLETTDSEGVVTKKNIVGAHRVRGHFKAKKWGVYWWRPHVRGVGELKEREGYKITLG